MHAPLGGPLIDGGGSDRDSAGPVIVGREAEVAAIVATLDTADRPPGAIVLQGEAGIGKTTLWLAGISVAVARGYRVLSCRPSAAEARFSYVGLADLLGQIAGDVLSALPPIQRRAIDAVLLVGESDLRAEERAVALAFLGVLRRLATDAPVCLAIDDVQWLDGASLAAVSYALDRLDREPIAVLFAARGIAPEWVRRVRPDDRRNIEMTGLSIGELRQVLRRRLDATYPRPLLLRLWETSGGNPFFALELATALARRGGTVAPGEDLPIPSDLNELLQTRLRGLGPAARGVARAVAALADPTIDLVDAAVGRSGDAGLAEAVAAGVLEIGGDRLRFTHPLLGRAVVAGQAPSRRRSLHARLATLVPSAEEKARHLALATDGPDEGVAAALEAAAEAAQVRGAPSAAGELAEQALRLTEANSGVEMRRRLLLAADMHRRAGDIFRATELLTTALAGAAAGNDRAVVLLHLADTKAAPASIPLYEQALAETVGSAATDDRLQATIHLRLANAMNWGAGWQQRMYHAELSSRAASRVDDAALYAHALAGRCVTRFYAGYGLDVAAMDEAVALERTLPSWPLRDGPTYQYGLQLFWSADTQRGRDILDDMARGAETRNDPLTGAWARWFLGFLEWRAGRWERADRLVADALDVMAQFEELAPPAEFPASVIAAHRGQVDAARARSVAAIGRGEAAGIRIAESGHSWVLGFLELSLGQPGLAVPHLQRSYEIRNDFMLEPAQRLELGDLLEALIAVGKLDAAAGIIDVWRPRAAAVDRAWMLAILHRGHGLLQAARGDVDSAFTDFERALAEHARSPDPFHRARTLLAVGRTRRRAGHAKAARSTLDDALVGFERLGSPLWADQTRAELARIGGRGPSSTELTEAERRIAALVAEGHTNREVAAALFLTVHTVETALTRIYRKLGIRSRAQLAATTRANT